MMTAYKSKNLKEFTLVWALAITGQWKGCTTNFPLDAFALLYFAFSLSFFQREGCPWDRVSLYWQSLKDEKGNLSYTQWNWQMP
jgi:hypothetical protein